VKWIIMLAMLAGCAGVEVRQTWDLDTCTTACMADDESPIVTEQECERLCRGE
jgi:hypothetical protein